MGLDDEFSDFIKKNRKLQNKEQFLIERAVTIMKAVYPFLETWFKSAHGGTGFGAEKLMREITSYIRDVEK